MFKFLSSKDIQMPEIPKAISRARSLDDWYQTVNRIYIDRNFYRDANSIFGHLVEVVGGLSLLGTEKQKPKAVPESFVPKTLAWWLALCGKMGIRSVEDMLWGKFPYCCAYCKLKQHLNDPCVEAKTQSRGPEWEVLKTIGESNAHIKPKNLAAWQRMFFDIYPPGNDAKFDTPLLRFSEELGELAEAIRVHDIAPGYFLSEASDVFAWLMNLQNVWHSRKKIPSIERGYALSDAFADAYPDACRDCGNPICTCPPVLPGTLGRIAHEVPSSARNLLLGGVLMSTDEARGYFELGSESIKVGSIILDAEHKLIREIHEVTAELRIFAIQNKELSNVRSIQLAKALAALESITSSQRVTQESVDKLAEAIASLPSEGRNALISFLTGLGSSVWANSLLALISRLTA